jgi:hypothetical protein
MEKENPMASAEVSLELDTTERILFAHSPLKAFGFTLVSLCFTLICWFSIQDDATVRYGFTVFSLLFVIAGLFGVFWRRVLDIDLIQRRVRDVRGMWPNPTTTLRNLDDAEGIWLRMEYRNSGSKSNREKVPWWTVSLKYRNEKGTKLFVTRDEIEGRGKWEHLAERLNLMAVDATGEKEERKSPEALDTTVATKPQTARKFDRPVQPADSLAEIRVEQGRRTVVLPPTGFSGGLVFLVLFGTAFSAMGGSVLFSTLGIIDMQVQGSPWTIQLVPPIFIFMGLGIIWLGIRGSYSSLSLGVDGDELYIEQLAFGRCSGRRSVRLSEIEKIDVAGDVRSRHRSGANIRIGGLELGRKQYRPRNSEVVVRSDSKILRFGGFLPKADKEWLADLCRFAARHRVLA